MLLASCATAPVPPRDVGRAEVDAVVDAVTDSVFGQADAALGSFGRLRAGSTPIAVVLDTPLDAAAGQRTALTERIAHRALARVAERHRRFAAAPIATADAGKAVQVWLATVTREGPAGAPTGYRLDMALVGRADGVVAAQASGRFEAAGLDVLPGRFEQDSPVLADDPVVRGYLRTAAAAPGTPADAAWRAALDQAPLLAQGIAHYEAARHEEALVAFDQAAAADRARQLRALNGVYLANWRLGRRAEAEQAFGRIVDFGIAERTLGVKFLFAPGSTAFWPEPAVTDMYDAWLRQIARRVDAAGGCLEVVGHSSRTGTEAFNDALSGQRAATIAQRLADEAAALAARSRTMGMGFRENLVGLGTDDARDALDRRVAFRFVGCP